MALSDSFGKTKNNQPPVVHFDKLSDYGASPKGETSFPYGVKI